MTTAAIALAPGVYRIPTTRFDRVNTFAFLDADGGVTFVDAGLRVVHTPGHSPGPTGARRPRRSP